MEDMKGAEEGTMAVSIASLEEETTKAVSEDAVGEAKTAVQGTKAVSDWAAVGGRRLRWVRLIRIMIQCPVDEQGITYDA